MTGSLTGLELFHNKFDLPLSHVLHTEAPYYLRGAAQGMSQEEFSADCAAKLEEMILAEGPDTIAAFIGEPILGTGGIVPPPAGYWAAIQVVLKKYDILLIADEVVTGFGRMGSMMGSPHFGIEPDIITIAKGLTSAYAPLSGSIISDKIWKVLEQGTDENGPIGHGWTYSAHPIGAAAGVANLKLVDEMGLVENAGSTGKYLLDQLTEAFADHPNVAEVRGEGLMCAVEFAQSKSPVDFFDPAKKIGYQISTAMANRDVIARAMPQGDIIGFAPPLCITPDEVDQVVAVAKEAVVEVLG